MNYTLDRFPARERPEIMEIIRETVQLSTLAGSLGRILEKFSNNKKRRTEAQKVLAAYIKNTGAMADDSEAEGSIDLVGKMLGKILKFIGKRIIKAVVRAVLEFAGRMAMNILRIAARAVLRFVIVPIFEAVVGFVLANPVTAAALAVIAAAGGACYLYRKYVKPEDVVEIEAPQASGAVVGEASPEVAPQQAAPSTEVPVEAAPSRVERTIDAIKESAPIKAVEKVFETPKKFVTKKGAKFQGFGSDVDAYIHEASQKYPILPEPVLRGFIKMEAGWTGNMSPTGAIGTGQFTAGTWNRLIPRGGAEIGMLPVTGIYGEEKDAHGHPVRPSIKPNPSGNFRTTDDPRFNRRVNTLATGLLAAGNAEMLKKAGLPITGANLYLMHNIGPGIIPVMKGQSATGATIKAMQQNGMGGAINTPSKFLEFQKGRFESAYQDANTSTDIMTDQPQLAKSMALEPVPKTSTTQPAPSSGAVLPQASNQSTDLIKGPGNSIVRM